MKIELLIARYRENSKASSHEQMIELIEILEILCDAEEMARCGNLEDASERLSDLFSNN